MSTFALIVAVFLVGVWGVMAADNMVRKVIALSIANTAVIMLYVAFAALSGDAAPINGQSGEIGVAVDPIPHALMLTAIVVGVCVTALALLLVYRLYRLYGTLSINEIESRAWGEDA